VRQAPSKQFGLGYETGRGVELRLADPFGIAARALSFINGFRFAQDAACFGLCGLQNVRCLVEPCRLTLRQDMAACRQGKIELLQPINAAHGDILRWSRRITVCRSWREKLFTLGPALAGRRLRASLARVLEP